MLAYLAVKNGWNLRSTSFWSSCAISWYSSLHKCFVLLIMVSGDGGLDIGMGSAIGTALRGHRLLLFEYDCRRSILKQVMEIRYFKACLRIRRCDNHAASCLEQKNHRILNCPKQQVQVHRNPASWTRAMSGRQTFVTLHVLRPFPADEICEACMSAERILIADRQDSYGAGGGNLSLEIRAACFLYPSCANRCLIPCKRGKKVPFFQSCSCRYSIIFKIGRIISLYGIGSSGCTPAEREEGRCGYTPCIKAVSGR